MLSRTELLISLRIDINVVLQALEFLQRFQENQRDDVSLMLTDEDYFFNANTGM